MQRYKFAGPQFGTRTGSFSNGYVVDLGSAKPICTAGHLALDADGNLIGGSDAAKQAEFIYGLLEKILIEAGSSLNDVVMEAPKLLHPLAKIEIELVAIQSK